MIKFSTSKMIEICAGRHLGRRERILLGGGGGGGPRKEIHYNIIPPSVSIAAYFN